MSQKLTDTEELSIPEKKDLEGKCHALWLLKGGETEKWNGDSCSCEIVQGILCCKLNPF